MCQHQWPALDGARGACVIPGHTVGVKLQYFGHLMLGADSLEKTLLLGKIEGRRRKGRQRMRWSEMAQRDWEEEVEFLYEQEGEEPYSFGSS